MILKKELKVLFSLYITLKSFGLFINIIKVKIKEILSSKF